MRILVQACVLILFLAGPVAAQRPSSPLGEAAGAILQADGPTAHRLLSAIDASTLPPDEAAERGCMLDRLDPDESLDPVPEDAPFALKVLHAYRQYWQDGTQRPEARAAAEAALDQRLATLLGQPDTDDVRARALARIQAEGGYALGGQTGRLQELMLWSRQEERDVTVALPEGPRKTRLFLLDDFQSLGWSRWMTCDRTGTGGWAKPEGLYAVVPTYDSLEDETFAVTFLAHEAQHFADNAAWSEMPSWQLEFRAKLTELVLARQTRTRVLDRFMINQGDDPSEPHSYANRRVLNALRQRLDLAEDADLSTVRGSALRAAALTELRADTASRPTPRLVPSQ